MKMNVQAACFILGGKRAPDAQNPLWDECTGEWMDIKDKIETNKKKRKKKGEKT